MNVKQNSTHSTVFFLKVAFIVFIVSKTVRGGHFYLNYIIYYQKNIQLFLHILYVVTNWPGGTNCSLKYELIVS